MGKGGVTRALITCRVSLAGIVGAAGTPLGGVVYGDTFLPVAAGAPLVVTSAVPLTMAWPAEGVETEACDGTRDAMQKILRSALQKLGKGKTKRFAKEDAAPAPAPLNSAGMDGTADDDVNPDVKIDVDLLELRGEEGDDTSDVEGYTMGKQSEEDDDDDDLVPPLPLSQRYTLHSSLNLAPSVLVSKPEPVLMFARAGEEEEEDAVAAVAAGAGGFKGEWQVYENGVVFTPCHAHAPALPLVFGANVTGVEVHAGLLREGGTCSGVGFSLDIRASGALSLVSGTQLSASQPINDGDGEAIDVTEAIVVFRLSGGVGGGCAVPPMHLCGAGVGVVQDNARALCFSLAPMGLKARRYFLREVVPRWKSAAESAGIVCVGSRPPFAAATRAQRYVMASERAAVAATAAGTTAQKTYPMHAPDFLAAAAASAASDCLPIVHPPIITPTVGAIPVTLLTGTPDGCQDDIVCALVDFASSTATWVVVEVPLCEGGGLCTAREVLERAVYDALPRIQAARDASRSSLGAVGNGKGEGGGDGRGGHGGEHYGRAVTRGGGDVRDGAPPPPPHLLFIARTYQPAAAVGLALSAALAAVSSLSALSGAAVELQLGAITACVAADAFFETERRPALGALAQLMPAAANTVVVLPSGAHETSSRSTQQAGAANSTAAELMAEAATWVRSLARAASPAYTGARRDKGAEVMVVVGARALGDAPLAAVEGMHFLPPSSTKIKAPLAVVNPPWEARLLAATVGAAARARVSARHAAATGSIDLTALLAALRRAFAAGRRAPGPDAAALATLTPDARLAAESTRFTERDVDAVGAGAVLMHARVRWTIAGQVEEEAEADASGSQRTDGPGHLPASRRGAGERVFNLSSAAPFAAHRSGDDTPEVRA